MTRDGIAAELESGGSTVLRILNERKAGRLTGLDPHIVTLRKSNPQEPIGLGPRLAAAVLGWAADRCAESRSHHAPEWAGSVSLT